MSDKINNMGNKLKKDSPEWQQLRRDVPTFISSAAMYFATLSIVVSLLGVFDQGDTHAKQHILFWVLAGPLTFWAVTLANYGPKSVAVLRALMVLDSPVGLLILGYAYFNGMKNIHYTVGATIVTIVLVMIAIFFYRKSILRKLGPMIS